MCRTVVLRMKITKLTMATVLMKSTTPSKRIHTAVVEEVATAILAEMVGSAIPSLIATTVVPVQMDTCEYMKKVVEFSSQKRFQRS